MHIYSNYADKRALALRGKFDFSLLYYMMLSILALSYVSFFCFPLIAASMSTKRLIEVGLQYVPGIYEASHLSGEQERSAFVMTIQWIASIVYVLTLFVAYFPFSIFIRIASHRFLKKRPGNHRGLRGILFFLFATAFILGDFKVIKFPTFFNGGLISANNPIPVFVALMNSSLMMPFLAWLFVFCTIMIYWLYLYAIANFRPLFGF